MKRKSRLAYLIAILTLSLAATGLYVGTALCGPPSEKGGWIEPHIMAQPDMKMYEPYFDLFGQREPGREVKYTYEETVKLAGHSCGASASAWEITKKALEVLYPDETPVRGNIMVYAPGAESEWNIGVLGEIITYITGAAPATGFTGAEFANGAGGYPGDPVYSRRNKMVYKAAPSGTMPPNRMIWKFKRIDTNAEVCLRFKYVDFPPLGDIGIQPPATPDKTVLGAKVASGMATPEEQAAFIDYWNARNEYVFANADSLVVVTECPAP